MKEGKLIKKWCTVVSDLVFPPVCACCGQLTMNRTDVICRMCLKTRFEPDEDASIILPESVLLRFSLWKFDKMGYLQDLLHKLKYEHLTGVGNSLGREAGRQLKEHRYFDIYPDEKLDPLLVPVPLHKKRYRKRGYNQARVIAEGISNETGFALAKMGTVIRIKNTKTQTGLNSDERAKNISKAFEIRDPNLFRETYPVLVDDVYTTGATTFELAGSIHRETGKQSAIVTIARA